MFDCKMETAIKVRHKFDNISILYLLVCVNQRFHRLALDYTHVRDLDFIANGKFEEYHQFFDRFSASTY